MKKALGKTTQSGREGKIPDHFFRELQIEFLVHELKDPMAIIEGGVRALLEKREKFGSLLPRQEKTLRRVLRGALKGRSMLNNLLEIGRSEAGQFVSGSFHPTKTVYISLLDAIETMEGEFFEQVGEQTTDREVLAFLAQMGISFNISSEVVEVEIIQDETKFSQIVGNLIKNALRFRREKLEINLYREGDMLVVEISDDGPGIKPENRDLIFQLYAQAEAEASLARKGHGLGLAGALMLARRLGGDISVQIEADEGATFRLTVPVKLEMENKEKRYQGQ